MNKPISAALISVAGTMLSDGERRLIEQYRPLGVSLFARNIESRSQLAELTRQIREAAEDENIIIAVDQEGGRVRRLAEPEFRPYASQYVLGKIGETYGQEEAEKLRATADYEVTKTLAEAERQGRILRGEGDAESAKLFADAFSQDPGFYSFIRSLRAYEKSFQSNQDVMVLSPDSDFFRYMRSPDSVRK